MKVPKSVINMLENKYVLYFVLFLAVSNILGYMVMGNLTSVIFFILVAYLASCFSKNMIIILSVPLIFTSVLMVGAKVKEGFDSTTQSDITAVEAQSNETVAPTATPAPTVTPSANKKMPTAGDPTPLVQGSSNLPITPSVKPTQINPADEGVAASEQDGMTTMYQKKQHRIDYASTIEDAYSDLNKIIGGDGIKRLTDDTQKLMSQQLQLADAMKSMSPLLEQAKSMLQGFDMKNMGDLAQMAKQFTMPGGPPVK
jgi:hypothetical protein